MGSRVVFTWLNSALDPEPEVFDRWVARIREVKLESKGDDCVFSTFVVSDGGAPNARQRTVLLSDVRRGESPAAVVTNALNSPLKRGIATTFSWLNPGFQAFPPESSSLAFTHVGCAKRDQQEAVWEALVRMQLEVPLSRTLHAIAKQMDLPITLNQRAAGRRGA